MPIDQDTLEAIVQAVTTAMTVHQQTGSGRMDTKAIGGPPEWNSSQEEAGFVEWHIKIKAWLNSHDGRAQRWLNTARDADDIIETDDLDVQHFTDESERGALKRFNGMLYNILVTKLRGEAFNIASSARPTSYSPSRRKMLHGSPWAIRSPCWRRRTATWTSAT